MTTPIISSVSPATSATVNSAYVSYTLSEAFATGTVTYTRTSGSADEASPHVVNLAGSELSSGAFSGALAFTSCERTLVGGRLFKLTNGSDEIESYQSNNYVSQGGVFIPGQYVVPHGQDCSLALFFG
jgi:hypothetical protein